MLGRFGRALLVLAVLLAQQTALAHQYWHASKAAVSAEAQNPAKSDGLCDLHDLLGTVLGVASGGAQPLAFVSLSEPRFTSAAAVVCDAALLAPHSRDPPLIS